MKTKYWVLASVAATSLVLLHPKVQTKILGAIGKRLIGIDTNIDLIDYE
jgi:hypothetical protein